MGMREVRVRGNKMGGEMKGAMWGSRGTLECVGSGVGRVYYIIYIIIYNYIIMGIRWG